MGSQEIAEMANFTVLGLLLCAVSSVLLFSTVAGEDLAVATLAEAELKEGSMERDLERVGDTAAVHSLLTNTTNSTGEVVESPCMKLEGGARIICEDKEEEEAKKAWKDGWANSGGHESDAPPANRDCAGCEEK